MQNVKHQHRTANVCCNMTAVYNRFVNEYLFLVIISHVHIESQCVIEPPYKESARARHRDNTNLQCIVRTCSKADGAKQSIISALYEKQVR